jgi:ferredoxin
MADKSIRLPENVPGPWYVDDTCTPCHVCLDEAGPQSGFSLLQYNDDETKVYFVKQPVSPEELAAAQSALEICPTAAIGDDGDE